MHPKGKQLRHTYSSKSNLIWAISNYCILKSHLTMFCREVDSNVLTRYMLLKESVDTICYGTK